MTAKESIDLANEKMQKSLSVLKKELASMRAGRANAQVLERVTVEYYGAQMPINQVANLSIPEPRVLTIAPWEASMLTPIEKAIQMSDLGINPTSDGKVIRLVFPELTEERRKDLVKQSKKKGEEAKVAVRAIRRDCNDHLKKLRKDNEITEDDQKEFEEKVQKMTDGFIKDIDKMLAEKEKEILSL